MFDLEIPYTTANGINYLIKFKSFPLNRLPEGINLPIVDIVIETDAASTEIINDGRSLIQMTRIILDYMQDKDAILYSYCSNKEINKSKRNLHLTNQEFRSSLFSKMFDFNKSKDLINRVVIINDTDNGHHYLHLIGNSKHQKDIDFILDLLQGFDK